MPSWTATDAASELANFAMTSLSEAPRSSWSATVRARSASMRLDGGVAATALLLPENSDWIEPSSCVLNGVPPLLTREIAAVAPERCEPVVADPEKRIVLGFRISPPFSTVYRPNGRPT